MYPGILNIPAGTFLQFESFSPLASGSAVYYGHSRRILARPELGMATPSNSVRTSEKTQIVQGCQSC